MHHMPGARRTCWIWEYLSSHKVNMVHRRIKTRQTSLLFQTAKFSGSLAIPKKVKKFAEIIGLILILGETEVLNKSHPLSHPGRIMSENKTSSVLLVLTWHPKHARCACTHTHTCMKAATSKFVYFVLVLWLNFTALKPGEALSMRESQNQLQRHLRHKWFFAALADYISCANMYQLISLKLYWIVLSLKFCWKRPLDYLSPKMLLIKALLSNPIFSY